MMLPQIILAVGTLWITLLQPAKIAMARRLGTRFARKRDMGGLNDKSERDRDSGERRIDRRS
jgi:hypothetical protein